MQVYSKSYFVTQSASEDYIMPGYKGKALRKECGMKGEVKGGLERQEKGAAAQRRVETYIIWPFGYSPNRPHATQGLYKMKDTLIKGHRLALQFGAHSYMKYIYLYIIISLMFISLEIFAIFTTNIANGFIINFEII